jgi:hypothetical protein
VAELQSVIGREAREQMLAAEGRLPEAVVACVGGGSNAIGIFHGFLEDEDVRLVGVEAAGAASLGSGRPAPVPFVGALLIYLREGVEAALLVGALLAGVSRLGREDARRWVHAGWLAALPAGVLTWWLAGRVLSVTAADRELSEAVIALVAAAVLFSMSFWMISKVEARRWTGYLRKGLEESLSRRNLLLLSALSFLAVYREAAETVLFTQALVLESPGRSSEVWMGAAAGLAAVVVLGRELGFWRFPVPENARLVPEDVQHRAQWGALQFGFEMGTGMRTYSPSALPHLVLVAVLLVVPLPAAFALAAGFALGRLVMPVLSNAWSDDGSWTAVWARAERVVRPLLALTCVGALALAILGP